MPLQRGVRDLVPEPTDGSDPYAALCAVLWSERDVLESLACTTATESGLLERLHLQEVLRAAMVEAVGAATAAPVPQRLAELARRAPEPWATMLQDHRQALRSLLKAVDDLAGRSGTRQLSLAEFVA